MYDSKKFINIIMAAAYLLSFLCFYFSSGFEYIAALAGSKTAAVLIVNLSALVWIVGATAFGKSRYTFAGIACGILLFIPVFAQSKFNWFENIFNRKMEAHLPPVVVAAAAFLVFTALIFENIAGKLDKKLIKLEAGGADLEALKLVKEKHLSGFGYIGVFISGFAVVAFVFAFALLPLVKSGSDPNIFLLAGAAVAAVSLVTYVFMHSGKK